MHCKNIVHRDIKPENFLLDGSDLNLKLIDFGLSTYLPDGERLKDRQGTPYYIAPEVISKDSDNKCDAWSCGVILYAMLCGRPPFNAENDLEILRQIKVGRYFMGGPQWDKVSVHAKDLVNKLLEYDPKKRYSVKQALDHEWFYIEKLILAQSLTRQNALVKQKKKADPYKLSKPEI